MIKIISQIINKKQNNNIKLMNNNIINIKMKNLIKIKIKIN